MTAISEAPSIFEPRAGEGRLLRIAHVSDWCLPRRGGLELQLTGLVRALASRGHDVQIVTATPGDDRLDGIRVHRLPGYRLPFAGVAASSRQFAALRDILHRGAFEVVHVHSGIIAPLAYGTAAIAARSGLPVLFTFHSVYDYLRPGLRALGWLGRARELPIAWSAVSGFVARETRETLRLDEVAVLPNGIDPEPWRVARPAPFAGELRLVAVMRLHPRKRARALFPILEQAQRLAGSRARITLDLVGDGVERGAVERLARQAGHDRVRVHGWLERDAIARLFAQSHGFVLPTRMESFGIAALEAMCAGLPVVARRDTGVEDFVIDRVSGIFGRSDAELARAIATLAVDDELRASIAAHNRAQKTPYAWPQVAARAESGYRAAMALRR